MTATSTWLPSALTVRDSRAATRTFLLGLSLAVYIGFEVQIAIPLAGNLRWLLLAFLAVGVVSPAWRLGEELPLPLTLVGLLYFCLVTFVSVGYSDVPLLSLYKAISFALLVAAIYASGLLLRDEPERWLRLLAIGNVIIIMLSVIATVLGMVSPYNGPYFRGIYLNSNDLAAFLALTLPALLWSRERKEWLGSLPFQGAIATLALIANLVILYLSRSRTGIAAALLVLLVYSVFRSKRLAVVGLFAAIVVALAAPSLLIQAQQNVLYKGLPPVQSLADRRALVTASLVAAESRVLEGHGFGVSVGASQTWNGALTTRDTSREKSSSVLGAIEEVGLIGTVPLLLSILAAIVIAYKRVRAEASSAARAAAIALFSIAAAGLLHSQSESWLTSAGSTSALIFWTTLGIIILRGSHQVRPQASS